MIVGAFLNKIPPVDLDEQMEHDARKQRCSQPVIPHVPLVSQEIVDCESLPNIKAAIEHARKMRGARS